MKMIEAPLECKRLILTVGLLQSSAESTFLFLHSHEGRGSLQQLTTKRLCKEAKVSICTRLS